MKKLIEIDDKRLKVNPFAASLKIEATRITDSGKYIPDENGVMHPIEYILDREQHVKLFYSPGAKKLIYGLSPAAKSLFLYILYSLESGQDYILLNKENYMIKNKITSMNTYRKAVNELWDMGFIAPSAPYPKDVYWINPIMFFSGSRIAKYPDNVIIKSTITK